MPKPLIISMKAAKELNEILKNIGEFTGSANSIMKFKTGFQQKFAYISNFPKACRMLEDGTRQAFYQRYRIIYQEFDNEILIITVKHSLKKYPE